mmetsp:Transcript_28436/g.91801  ORF Transcript_28436/g.91801 Transcript_28436/m.91801 type:complete len:236 (-) Transcript_28436:333-1040(-)
MHKLPSAVRPVSPMPPLRGRVPWPRHSKPPEVCRRHHQLRCLTCYPRYSARYCSLCPGSRSLSRRPMAPPDVARLAWPSPPPVPAHLACRPAARARPPPRPVAQLPPPGTWSARWPARTPRCCSASCAEAVCPTARACSPRSAPTASPPSRNSSSPSLNCTTPPACSPPRAPRPWPRSWSGWAHTALVRPPGKRLTPTWSSVALPPSRCRCRLAPALQSNSGSGRKASAHITTGG